MLHLLNVSVTLSMINDERFFVRVKNKYEKKIKYVYTLYLLFLRKF